MRRTPNPTPNRSRNRKSYSLPVALALIVASIWRDNCFVEFDCSASIRRTLICAQALAAAITAMRILQLSRQIEPRSGLTAKRFSTNRQVAPRLSVLGESEFANRCPQTDNWSGSDSVPLTRVHIASASKVIREFRFEAVLSPPNLP